MSLPRPRVLTACLAVLSAAVLAVPPAVAARDGAARDAVWEPVASGPPALGPTRSRHGLNAPALEALLARAAGGEAVTIHLPRPDGSYGSFTVEESPVMAPGLAKRYPRIKTYRGRGVDDPAATMRLSWTPLGLHAIVLSPRSAEFVEPERATGRYVSYGLDAARTHGFRCLVRDEAAARGLALPPAGSAP